MAAGTEADDLLDFIIATLEADATLAGYGLHGWYKDLAVEPEGWPYGVVSMQSAVDIVYPGPRRIGSNIVAQVKLVGPDGIFTSTLKPAYQRVYQVLFGLMGTTSDVEVWGKLWQEAPVSYVEVVGGQLIRHFGGDWRSQAA